MRDSQGREVRQFLVGEWGPGLSIPLSVVDAGDLAAAAMPRIRAKIAEQHTPKPSQHLLPIAIVCFAIGWAVTAIVLRRHR